LEKNLYKFVTENGEVYVAWDINEIPLEGEVYVVDIYGNVKEKEASEIKAGEEPIYVFKSSKIIERLDAMKERNVNPKKLGKE